LLKRRSALGDDMRAYFDHTEHLSSNIDAFWFRPEGRFRYTAGQFVEFQLPHADMDERGDKRWFTLTSVPGQQLISFAAIFPEHGSSYKRALRAIQPGTAVEMSEPLGDFVLPKDPTVPMVWVAGGVAAAAFAAMAKELAASGKPRAIAFFQSARQAEELLFANCWQAASLEPQQTVTQPDASWQGRTTRFNADEILAAAPGALGQTLFYVSGSNTLVESLCSDLAVRGVAREQIVREAFI
jgi:glycine betaine catabolism B